MENESNKSQEATPQKLSEARKKGQVGRSIEFVSLASLVAIIFGLIVALPKLGHAMSLYVSNWIINANQIALSPALMGIYLKAFVKDILSTIGLLMFLGVAAAIVSSIVHAGSVFSLHPLKLDLSKLNPVNGFKKIFSRKGLVDIFRLLLKIIFFSIAMYFVWGQIRNLILYPASFSLATLSSNWRSAFIVLVSALILVYTIFASFDLWYSKREFAKKMRMSERDIKDEHKRREGDPDLKNKRKRSMMALLKNISGVSHLKDADVIITNPTHIAVALQYRSKSMVFPVVLAKGKGFFAKWIIKKAYTYGVPVIRRPPLARKIYAESKIKGIIPLSEQQEIAEIYKEIIKNPKNKVFS